MKKGFNSRDINRTLQQRCRTCEVYMLSQYPKRIFRFYVDGFRNMTLGKTLWKIILIKLFVMFAVLKVFFFENYLNANFDTDQEKASHVLEQITDS